MGILSSLKTDTPATERTRWVEALEEDPASGEPAVEVQVAYINQNKMQNLIKPFQNKSNPSDSDEKKFRKSVMRASRDWRGVTVGNLTRLSDWLLEHPDEINQIAAALEEGGLDELPYSLEDAQWLCERMDGVVFKKILDGASSQADFAAEALSGKSSTSSSDSA